MHGERSDRERGHMDRRAWLRAAGATVTLASLPGWMASCTGSREAPEADSTEPRGRAAPGRAIPPTEAERVVAAAVRAARARCRPLLIFLNSPYSEDARNGELLSELGVLIQHACSEDGADLAMCDLHCARRDQIPAGVLAGQAIPSRALVVLVDEEGRPCRFLESIADLDDPSVPAKRLSIDVPDEDVRARSMAVAAGLRAFLIPDTMTLRRWAVRQREWALGSAGVSESGPMTDTDVPTARQTELAPAWVRWRAETAAPAERAALVEMLSNETARRWRKVAPPGTLWARSMGCGVDVEGREPSGVLCGMGFTPEYSQRFLIFYVEESS